LTSSAQSDALNVAE